MNTTRGLYIYGVSFAGFVATTLGAVLVLTAVLETTTGRALAGDYRQTLSIGIAMVLVGGPLWAVHHWLGRRQVERNPAEAGSVVRKLYVYAALGIAALFGVHGAQGFLAWVLRDERMSGLGLAESGVAVFVVMAVFWAYLWYQERAEGQPGPGARTVRRWYLYVVSFYLLVALLLGLTEVLGTLANSVYVSLTGVEDLTGRDPILTGGTTFAIATIATAGSWWAVHWLVFARGDAGATLRLVYLYLFAFLGGALLTLQASASILYTLFSWLLGVSDFESGVTHFSVIPPVVPRLLLGVALLGYHWSVIRREAPAAGKARATTPRRAFTYIVAAGGLASLVLGVVALLMVVLTEIFPDASGLFEDRDAAREAFAFAATAIIIGAPLWLYYWPRIQRLARVDGSERRALTRRIYIYGVLGIAALSGLGSLTALLSQILFAVLDGRLSTEVLNDVGPYVAVVLPMAVLFMYHLQVVREDARHPAAKTVAPEPQLPRRRITLAAPEQDADDLATRLTTAAGTPVIVVMRTMGQATEAPDSPGDDGGAPAEGTAAYDDAAVAAAAALIAESPVESVLVVADGGALRVFPYT